MEGVDGVAEGVGEEGEEWGDKGNDDADDADETNTVRSFVFFFLEKETKEPWHPSLLYTPINLSEEEAGNHHKQFCERRSGVASSGRNAEGERGDEWNKQTQLGGEGG